MEPPDDESIPAESQDVPLNLPTSFSLSLSRLDPCLTAQSVKRSGETLESGSTKEPRTERANRQQGEGADPKKDPSAVSGQQRDANMEDYGIFPSNDDNIR